MIYRFRCENKPVAVSYVDILSQIGIMLEVD